MKHAGNYESSRRSNTLRCSDFRVKLYVDSAPEKADQRMPKVQDIRADVRSQSLRQKDGDKYDIYPMYAPIRAYIGSYCVCHGAEQILFSSFLF